MEIINMTKEELKTEIRKYLKDDEFLTSITKKISIGKISNNILKLPYNIIKNVDSIVSLDWKEISYTQRLTENFIREFHDKVDWSAISDCQKLSENFIKEFQNRVNWGYISASQRLSEDFIIEFKDKVNWIDISEYQILSEDFILDNLDKINFERILMNKQISKFKDKTLQCYYELNYTNKGLL
jgi:hypothetical protein